MCCGHLLILGQTVAATVYVFYVCEIGTESLSMSSRDCLSSDLRRFTKAYTGRLTGRETFGRVIWLPGLRPGQCLPGATIQCIFVSVGVSGAEVHFPHAQVQRFTGLGCVHVGCTNLCVWLARPVWDLIGPISVMHM